MENCKILIRIYHFIIGLFIVLLLTVGCQTNNQKSNAKVSKFGKYEGYSKEKYESWERTSKYITMNDGVKLATDIIRPVENEMVVQKVLPVVWAYYRYHRTVEREGKVLSLVDRLPPLQTLIKHGYVIVVVDARGTGASFGNESKGPNTLQEAQHTYEITEWISSQEWCDGNVGMFGHSYSGNIQFLAAAHASPHLKAVFPSGATFDLYEIMYHGGVFNEYLASAVGKALHYYDIEAEAIPVDSDSSGSQLKQAKLERIKNINAYAFFKGLPYRDSRYKDYQFWLEGNPWIYLSDCNISQIPVYQWIGWKDFLIKDALQWYVNLKGPKKISIGWWSHDNRSSYELLGIEQLRWFDYWLKGIENGIMNESEIYYSFSDDIGDTIWNQARKWPLPEFENIEFYFVADDSENAPSGSNGLLVKKPVLKEKRQNEIYFPDSNKLIFTTPPLDQEMKVIGHPVVTLHLTTTFNDIDVQITLKEIDSSDKVIQVTKGILRVSHRTLTQPSFNNMTLPYHRHFKEDIKPITNEDLVELHFDLLPVAKYFKPGHRIQIVVSFDEAVNSADNQAEVPVEKSLTSLSLLKSNIVIPVRSKQ